MHATRARRNRDETVTKPLEFYRQNDETIGFYRILYSYNKYYFEFAVVSSFRRQNTSGFVTVSSWFRRGCVCDLRARNLRIRQERSLAQHDSNKSNAG